MCQIVCVCDSFLSIAFSLCEFQVQPAEGSHWKSPTEDGQTPRSSTAQPPFSITLYQSHSRQQLIDFLPKMHV